jgi:MFS family permease
MTRGTNFRKFILLWLGELISSVGGGLTSFGLGVYVFRMTGSAADMAMISLLAFLPTLLLSVPAGVLADRMDRRLLMMLGDGCSALGLIYILICMADGNAALWQIYVGVTISAVFSSLLDPAYKATISELLTKEEYAKASGLVSLAGSARYLISPIIAGMLLTITDIRLLLVIDILTFLLTVICTGIVRKGIENHSKKEIRTPFLLEMKEGWQAITEKKGVLVLVIMSSFMTLSMGALQVLSEPMVLDFADSVTLGTAETICACGMLVSSILLGIMGMKKGYVKVLGLSLCFAGIAMVVFGARDNIVQICIAGFAFFSMLPIANCCLDYLVRVNIREDLQGRAWGLIGFLSQIGYVVAYGAAGLAADSLARNLSISIGRGSGYIVMLFGAFLSVLAVVTCSLHSIRQLEGGKP